MNKSSTPHKKNFSVSYTKINNSLNLFMEDVSKQQGNRDITDFTKSDLDGRNCLHRAALEQNPKLLMDILQEYKMVLNAEGSGGGVAGTHQNQQDIKNKLLSFVNLKDKFGLSCLLMSCFSSNQLQTKQNFRLECLQLLKHHGAEINVANPRTLWSPAHWCSFYGDTQSVKFLLNNHCIFFCTEKNGFYPLDLAGRMNHQETAQIIIQHLVCLLTDFEAYNEDQRIKGGRIRVFNLKQEYNRQLSNPLLKVTLVYWACRFGEKESTMKALSALDASYYVAPMIQYRRNTSLHAAVEQHSQDLLTFILDDLKQNKRKGIQNRCKLYQNQKFNQFHNPVDIKIFTNLLFLKSGVLFYKRRTKYILKGLSANDKTLF